jgi:hypothetical protein
LLNIKKIGSYHHSAGTELLGATADSDAAGVAGVSGFAPAAAGVAVLAESVVGAAVSVTVSGLLAASAAGSAGLSGAVHSSGTAGAGSGAVPSPGATGNGKIRVVVSVAVSFGWEITILGFLIAKAIQLKFKSCVAVFSNKIVKPLRFFLVTR